MAPLGGVTGVCLARVRLAGTRCVLRASGWICATRGWICAAAVGSARPAVGSARPAVVSARLAVGSKRARLDLRGPRLDLRSPGLDLRGPRSVRSARGWISSGRAWISSGRAWISSARGRFEAAGVEAFGALSAQLATRVGSAIFMGGCSGRAVRLIRTMLVWRLERRCAAFGGAASARAPSFYRDVPRHRRRHPRSTPARAGRRATRSCAGVALDVRSAIPVARTEAARRERFRRRSPWRRR